MVQVSQRRLRPEIEKRVYELFWDSFAKMKNSKEAEEFLSDLLTHTEKIMLAKRLAIAVLLLKGFDYDPIKDILKVSGTTIASVQNQLRFGRKGYIKVAERLATEEGWREFTNFLQSKKLGPT